MVLEKKMNKKIYDNVITFKFWKAWQRWGINGSNNSLELKNPFKFW